MTALEWRGYHGGAVAPTASSGLIFPLRERLIEHLDEGSMGRITASGSSGELSIYVMEGEVLAARSDDDDTMLLRRLLRNGHVDKTQQIGRAHV